MTVKEVAIKNFNDKIIDVNFIFRLEVILYKNIKVKIFVKHKSYKI